MSDTADIFEQHYREYCERLTKVDFGHATEILGLVREGDRVGIPFLNDTYWVSSRGITDAAGDQPAYGICVILAKYLLLCPSRIHIESQWVAFKEFRKVSHFTNVNFFASDTERALVKRFTGRLDELHRACRALGGFQAGMEMPYDLCMTFTALPRVALLLLFNDADEEFPAKGTVLFQQQAEHYLDPESLAMTSAALVKRLGQAGPADG